MTCCRCGRSKSGFSSAFRLRYAGRPDEPGLHERARVRKASSRCTAFFRLPDRLRIPVTWGLGRHGGRVEDRDVARVGRTRRQRSGEGRAVPPGWGRAQGSGAAVTPNRPGARRGRTGCAVQPLGHDLDARAPGLAEAAMPRRSTTSAASRPPPARLSGRALVAARRRASTTRPNWRWGCSAFGASAALFGPAGRRFGHAAERLDAVVAGVGHEQLAVAVDRRARAVPRTHPVPCRGRPRARADGRGPNSSILSLSVSATKTCPAASTVIPRGLQELARRASRASPGGELAAAGAQLEHAVIARIGDVEVAVRAEGQGLRGDEAGRWPRPGPPQACSKWPSGEKISMRAASGSAT